jgi:hypothetical protein
MSNPSTIESQEESMFRTLLVLEKPAAGQSSQDPTTSPGSPTSHSSPTSQVSSDNYPAPLADAAFHGLAGEVVRMIEPHTEADPAALLFQFLAGFGNIIGRDAFMMADGARHCMNLFGVLVGQSSKGRKGTSWNQIARLLERVDEEWKSGCVKSGLNSGEGLIFHVRDAISNISQEGNDPGDCKERITDAGVADKRLFLAEGEFASTLKVMEREANTLSPIIRMAWDGGILSSLTKNTPVKSTGAHITFIGHITRDELLRYLNQTEAANGFANRFCWLAVRRSKCLPDGGRIHTVNFEDITGRLKSAVDFARDAGELTRDAAATLLWHSAYPLLSEGKPGMLGAVTGRSEAQVMRLSAIYALLDESRIIRPAHHHAAIALWDYCVRSTRWIFGTATGDKNADKLLEALRQAGPAGLTRMQITIDIFKRHLNTNALTASLRILQETGEVTCVHEPGVNGVTERWFASGKPAK